MSKSKSTYVTSGIGMGTALAICMSWTHWHSIWWAILHGFFSWFYVIYYSIQYM